MKKLLTITFILALAGSVAATQKTKIFGVRNGNGVVDNGVTINHATLISYPDAQSKQIVIDALCSTGNYDALPEGTRPSKQAFANDELRNWLNAKVKEHRAKLAEAQKPVVDESDLP